MAKRWNPDGKPVDPQERVGRRLLDLPELAGASEDQYYSRVRMTQFWDKDTGEVSLDRLGRSNIEPKVRNYLIPRAKKHAASFAKPKTFEGWAHIKAAELLTAKYPPSLTINASPILIKEGEDENDENIFHAHIDKPEDGYAQALHLRNLFEHFGDVERYSEPGPADKNEVPVAEDGKLGTLQWIGSQLARILRRIRS